MFERSHVVRIYAERPQNALGSTESQPFYVQRRIVYIAWKGTEETRWCVFHRPNGTMIISYADFAPALEFERGLCGFGKGEDQPILFRHRQ